jgi:hypothetical protein
MNLRIPQRANFSTSRLLETCSAPQNLFVCMARKTRCNKDINSPTPNINLPSLIRIPCCPNKGNASFITNYDSDVTQIKFSYLRYCTSASGCPDYTPYLLCDCFSHCSKTKIKSAVYSAMSL